MTLLETGTADLRLAIGKLQGGGAGAWFRGESAPSARVRLLGFPHAGGTAASVLRWFRAAPSWVQVLGVQYPGRADRFREAPVTEVEGLAHAAALQLRMQPRLPTILFGHSLGALVAYEVARRLEARGSRPCALFVSASRAPWLPAGTHKHLLDDAALWQEVARLGGTAQAVLRDAELRSLVLPALRADYRASECYRWRQGVGLSCPVVALVGDDDPDVEPSQTEPWREVTNGTFNRQVIRGGHFYLDTASREVLRAVQPFLRPYQFPCHGAAEAWPSTP